jgi:hypothetical protein
MGAAYGTDGYGDTSMEYTDEVKYVKILGINLIDNMGIRYEQGLNTEYKPETLYFTEVDNIGNYIDCGELIADVEIPPGIEMRSSATRSTLLSKHYYASQIIISNIRPVSSLPHWNDEKFCLVMVRQNGKSLKYVPLRNQTYEICHAAINQYPGAIKYVINQSNDLCIYAVSLNPVISDYIRSQNYNLWLSIVQLNGMTLRNVRDDIKTEAMCLAAVTNTGYALKHVPDELKTEEMCLIAVQQDINAKDFVPVRCLSHEIKLLISGKKRKHTNIIGELADTAYTVITAIASRR